ncbi:MAG: hypothetical protein ABF753_03285 [Lentilactobacillus hilgardii]|jgi:hypothetical protein|uniref:hypothetical protein n=1 Tax=Lentilactobacillus hilgardii TaxID=1588 RepID=UPI0039ECD12B|nr:hypothetical protein [Lentilactobacillus buchneri]
MKQKLSWLANFMGEFLFTLVLISATTLVLNLAESNLSGSQKVACLVAALGLTIFETVRHKGSKIKC